MGHIAEWSNQQYPDVPPLSTIKRDGWGVHHSITGMLLCPVRYEWDNERYDFFVFLDVLYFQIDRVRTKLLEADPEYNYTIDICLGCFYRNFNGSGDNPEKGFLQSALLVKVCYMLPNVMKLISYDRPSSTFSHHLPPRTTS